MKEKNNIGEQPKESVLENAKVLEKDEVENNLNTDELEKTESSGSPFGKFKNADSLHSAYLDLEKQFTKKSQRLSELEKAVEQDNVVRKTPCFERENWRSEVKEFLSSHSGALEHASDISNELISDNNLACLPNSLELAYAKVLARKNKSASELLNDKEFVENNILKNDNIKNRIIKEYIESVNLKKTPPVVLSNKGSSVGFSLPQKPANLQDAKAMVEKLFF